jgi:hypothetical protein
MWEIKETSPSGDLRHGHTVVGQTPVPLSSVSVKLVRGILLRTPGPDDFTTPNVDAVYVGRKGVTADTDPNTGGMPMLPGSAIELPLEDPSEVYVVTSTATPQDIAWMGV